MLPNSFSSLDTSSPAVANSAVSPSAVSQPQTAASRRLKQGDPDPLLSQQAIRKLGIDRRFSELRLLGSGGNCDVYGCYDALREQELALKRLGSQRTNRQADRARFLLEPAVLGHLNHPTIPHVFDVFPERMVKPYFTMEWISGVDLCRVLRGLQQGNAATMAAYPLPRLLEMICEVADGLSEAHAAGILHRDVKPENLMLTSGGGVKIVDWGVVLCLPTSGGYLASLDSEAPEKSQPQRERRLHHYRLTEVGQQVGTPLYMPPEQIDNHLAIDQRGDIFSLGAVLYDCLALTTLIRGQTRGDAFRYTMAGDYLPPSQVTLRASVPAGVEGVCLRAVAPDRRDRFADMTEFAEALRAELARL